MIKKSHFIIFRWLVIVFTTVLIAVGATFIFLHFRQFHGAPSSKLNDWSDFGSFFSGTVGVILSGLNFLIIAYLTTKVNRNYDQQWLTQLRSPFYKDIIEKSYSLTDVSLENKNQLQSYILWLEHSDFKNLLFLVDENEENSLNRKKDNLLSILKKIESHNTFMLQENVQLTKDFNLAKIEFTNYLAAIMMDQTKQNKK